MLNELAAQNSICVDCGSKKSIFVKEYKPGGKKKQFLQITNYKTRTFIVKTVKNTQETHFQKNQS